MGHGTPGKSWNLSEGHGKSWKHNMVYVLKKIRRQKDKKKIKKLQRSQEQPFISVEIDRSKHFMHYNSGKYMK